MTLQSEYLLGIVSARFASSGEERVHVQNDKDFAKAREGLKECMKDYRAFLLKAQGKFVFIFLFFYFFEEVAGKWISTLARRDKTRRLRPVSICN